MSAREQRTWDAETYDVLLVGLSHSADNLTKCVLEVEHSTSLLVPLSSLTRIELVKVRL